MPGWRVMHRPDMFPHTTQRYDLFPCTMDIQAIVSTHVETMASVTKQVKKYRNRLKIRDFERFAAFGSLLESLFSCFDNSVIVWVFV